MVYSIKARKGNARLRKEATAEGETVWDQAI